MIVYCPIVEDMTYMYTQRLQNVGREEENSVKEAAV